jgi:hypothetical protein
MAEAIFETSRSVHALRSVRESCLGGCFAARKHRRDQGQEREENRDDKASGGWSGLGEVGLRFVWFRGSCRLDSVNCAVEECSHSVPALSPMPC